MRAPKEYANGHIPNAHNIPLFNDEERHVVGKAYKEHGKDKAIELGISYTALLINNLIMLVQD